MTALLRSRSESPTAVGRTRRRAVELCLLPFLLAGVGSAQTVPVSLDVAVPPDTPVDASVHVAGDFQGWRPGDERYRLTRREDGRYGIVLQLEEGASIEYRLTRGSWESDEYDVVGRHHANRVYQVNGPETLRLEVMRWRDAGPRAPSEALAVIAGLPVSDALAVNMRATHKSAWRERDTVIGGAAVERLVECLELSAGSDAGRLAEELNRLGLELWRVGDLGTARPLWERALAIREELLGPDHLQAAVSSHNLAVLLRGIGELGEASALEEHVLAIRKAEPWPEHVDLGLARTASVSLDVAVPADTPANASVHVTGNFQGWNPGDERYRLTRRGDGRYRIVLELEEGASIDFWLTRGNWETEEYDVLGYRRADRMHQVNGPDTLRLEVVRWRDAGPMEPAQAFAMLAERVLSDELVAQLRAVHATALERGDTDTAQAIVARVLGWLETSEGTGTEDFAYELNELGLARYELGDLAAARPLWERALAIREEVLGPDHLHVAVSLFNLAHIPGDLGDFEEALSLYERALAIRMAKLGPEHVDVGSAMNGVAVTLSSLGRYKESLPIGEEVVRIFEQARGPDREPLAQMLDNLAVGHRTLRHWEEARTLLERALSIREATLDPDDERIAWVHCGLGYLAVQLGEYEDARMHLERALEMLEACAAPDMSEMAATLQGLGSLSLRLGDFGSARRHLERSLAIREARLGSDNPAVAQSLLELSWVEWVGAGSTAARPLLERALEIQEQRLPPDHPETAETMAALGFHLRSLGDYAAARPLLERALAIREASFGPSDPRYAECLNGLANLLLNVGELDDARILYERAIGVYEASEGAGDRASMLVAMLTNLSLLHLDQDEPQRALALAERAEALCEESVPAGRMAHGTSSLRLAEVLHELGRLEEARQNFERALVIRENFFGADHVDVAVVLERLVLVSLDLGDAAAAMAHARRLTGGRGQVRRALSLLTEGEGLLLLARHRRQRDAALAAAAAMEDAAAAYSIVLDEKGQVARLAQRTALQLAEGSDPGALALAEVQAQLSRLVLREAGEGAVQERQIDALRQKRERLERELRARADLEEEAPVSPAALAAALPTGSAVVDLLVHPAYIPAELEDGALVAAGRWSDPRVSAWIVRAGDERVRHVDLGPAASIEQATRSFLAELVSSRGVGVEGHDDERANAELRARVWDPLAAHLEGIDTIFLSPDGALATLPFGTLRDASGRYLVEDLAFVHTTETGSLVRRPAQVPAVREACGSLLAVGGVDFSARVEAPADEPPALPDGPSDGTLRGAFTSYWGSLPATRYESQVVADMHADATRAAGTQLLLQGSAATEERLKLEMPRHALLHLATHGFFQPEGLPSMWEQAVDAESGQRGLRMNAGAARLTGLHPGLLSGLVLAGANRPLEGAERDDGFLTAAEVGLLDLSEVELAVLSACDTGLGRPESGEGLLGLRRAIHTAGAKTVVSSLWSVKDERTSELMQAFYANLLLEGLGRHEALRNAQLDMLARNRASSGDGQPSTWGAFVLSGEWR